MGRNDDGLSPVVLGYCNRCRWIVTDEDDHDRCTEQCGPDYIDAEVDPYKVACALDEERRELEKLRREARNLRADRAALYNANRKLTKLVLAGDHEGYNRLRSAIMGCLDDTVPGNASRTLRWLTGDQEQRREVG